MASTSEKGHAKNQSNFEEFISFISGYGAAYNPSKVSIKLPALNTLSTNSKNALASVNTALAAYKTASDDREVAFGNLSKLSTRILNSLKASDTSSQNVESAASIIRKIQGKRASPKKTEEEKTAALANGKTIKETSSSQMSYDSRIENFDKLVKLLAVIPQYTPNETDLKVATLNTLNTTLRTKNSAVVAASTVLSNARLTRDTVFYKENTGMVEIAADAKLYIKSVFGASSPQYKQISKLQIRK